MVAFLLLYSDFGLADNLLRADNVPYLKLVPFISFKEGLIVPTVLVFIYLEVRLLKVFIKLDLSVDKIVCCYGFCLFFYFFTRLLALEGVTHPIILKESFLGRQSPALIGKVFW